MIGEIIPVLGVLTGLIVPVAVFIWLYHEEKGKRDAVIEIAKHLDDPAKVEQLLGLFDERKKAPIDYRRGGVIIYCLSVWVSICSEQYLSAVLFEGVGLLVGAIGIGIVIAGYLYPNTGEELTSAVEEFEKDKGPSLG